MITSTNDEPPQCGSSDDKQLNTFVVCQSWKFEV